MAFELNSFLGGKQGKARERREPRALLLSCSLSSRSPPPSLRPSAAGASSTRLAFSLPRRDSGRLVLPSQREELASERAKRGRRLPAADREREERGESKLNLR